ncbi:nidogen-like domain-containing protein [Sandaracinus amylolyticus]|uniref:nidogen-like domain-containing protein n=1 Tax=Sandaracinus amylolyticus TaxID=927083 RepID=UPI001F3CD610|nr:nidogen-like domain-containing protein [Sandaracinus amylolyticus]UJR79920.1 Alpha-tectorin [Sandaracinus amylolyticus]
MSRALIILAFAMPLVLVGCGESHAPEDDAGAPGIDGGAPPERDASQPPVDAHVPTSCVPGTMESASCGRCGTTERFCDTSGSWVYGECEGEGVCSPGETREMVCGDCGTQTETCSDACEWGAPSACEDEGECTPGERTRTDAGCAPGGTREAVCSAACVFEPIGECDGACDTPGLIEQVPCGTMCGTVERFCTAERRWMYDECVEAGVCVPGTTDTAPCGRCGTQARRCNSACAWAPAGECTGQGECTPGETTYSGTGCADFETRLRTCGATCTYDAGTCVAAQTELLGGLGDPEGIVAVGDDVSSPAIDLSAAFPSGLRIYGATYTTIFVNNNGNVSFGGALSTYSPVFPRTMPAVPAPLIAPWWGDVDTRGGGRPASNDVHWDIAGSRFVATWRLVGYFNSHVDLQNTFQVVLTDRSDVAPGDFDVEFRYTRCQWTTGDASSGTGGLGGDEASAGFEAGNATDYLALPGSGTPDVLDLCTTSNVGPPGLWRFQVRGGIPR